MTRKNAIDSTTPACEGGAPVFEERLPYFRPAHGEREIAAVTDTLRNGWLTVGPGTRKFREEFLAFTKLPCGHPVNSCTSALFLALKVLGVGPGDEVITTPNTFVASVNVVHHVGAEPVLADIELTTYGLDPEAVRAAITPRTKAILAVHYGGQPCYIEMLREIADEKGLLLIEDAAHAVATWAGGRHAGDFGDAAAFSFYVTKNLSTGEGGFLACRDPRVEEEIALHSLHGMDTGAWKRYTDRGSWFYEVHRHGYKFNMTDVQAALGSVQLERLPEMQAARAAAASRYFAGLAGEEALILPETREDAVHAWHLFAPRLRDGALRIGRDEFLAALTAEGVAPSLHFIPIHHHPVYREELGEIGERLPNSEAFYRGCFSLPLFPGITDAEIDGVCAALRKLIDWYRS